jgi:Uncharacterised conserved protein (DUF2228)
MSHDAGQQVDEDDARRAASLELMRGRFDAVAVRFRNVYGLRLPRQMAVFAAFWHSLNEAESAGIGHVGLSPAGITRYFFDLDLVARDGLDERLEWRFRCDPPEFVSVMHGNMDGLHFGLWYDDPAEIPVDVVHNYARDSAETVAGEATPLEEVQVWIEDYLDEMEADGEEPEVLDEVRVARRAAEWFTDAELRAVEEDGPSPWAFVERPEINIPMGPALPPGSGDPRGGDEPARQRWEAYRSRSPQVGEWIARARAELAAGQPAFALVLGQELHYADLDDYRPESLELLVGAYRALGRHALAEIAEVHHRHRDLPSVDVLVRASS